jgi:hypothetical protein
MSIIKLVVSETAHAAYRAIPSKRNRDAVRESLSLLEATPFIGVKYDPYYDSAYPPQELVDAGMRVLHAGDYGIYYVAMDEDRVYVPFIEDQRSDPKMRFKLVAEEEIDL